MNRNKYQRLTKEEKELLKKMTLDGRSLNQISQITGLGRTTIYHNVKRYKSRQWRKLIVNLPDEKIGELIGAFAGDGSYNLSTHGRSYHYKIRYTLSLSKDMQYAKYLINLLKGINLNPYLCKNKKGNVIAVLVHSKPYIKFIQKFVQWEGKKTYSIRLSNDLDKYSNDFLIGFARGLMDTDGFVEISNVSCGCISKRLIKNLTEILEKFRMRYKLSKKIRENRKDLFLIRVYRDSLEKYHNIIGFSNKYKLEGLRSILNKRE